MAKNVITDILKEINALPGLSVDNVIEKIENEMKTRYEAGKIWPDTFENCKEAGFDVNYKWYNDKALLHYAAEGGRERVIDALIQNGANIEVEDKYRNTPSHYAAANGHVEVAKTLIDKGADVNETGEQDVSAFVDMARCRRTPLHLTAKKAR